jgi:microtubule-associated protein-like 5
MEVLVGIECKPHTQVWQNVLCLLEYSDAKVSMPNGRSRVVLQPGRRFLCDLNMAAGVFVKYGFDADGLMPYVVFSQASGLI